MLNSIRVHVHTVGTSIRAALSLRESFLMQTFFLLAGNVIFFSFWVIYFSNFSSIEGWGLEEMALLFGTITGSYGVFTIFFGGTRYLARIIYEGDLDPILLRPRHPLLQVLGMKSTPSGWGDLLTTAILVTYSGVVSFKTLPLFLLLIASNTAIIVAFSILTGTLAFWITNSHSLGKQIFELILTFSNYPKAIYSGLVKVLLLTIIPAGFIGFLPIEVLKHPSLLGILQLLLFSSGYLFFAVKVFNKGLSRYTSGNLMGFRVG